MSDETKDKNGKISSIAEKARKKRRGGANATLVEGFMDIGDAIDHDPRSFLPHLENKYIVVENPDYSRDIVRVRSNDVCERVCFDPLINDLLVYTRKNKVARKKVGYHLSEKNAKECASLWMRTTQTVPEPKPFLFKDEPGLCYSRLPCRYDPTIASPLFDEMFSRMTNRDSARAFIGSLFCEHSYRQQCLWLYGDGQDGKGALVNTLNRVMGNASVFVQVPTEKGGSVHNQFFISELVGKRLAVFDDIGSPKFVTSAYFKGLSGGDVHQSNEKHRKQHKVRLNTKFVFTSNQAPDVSELHADKRRMILCRFTRPTEVISPETYEDRLWSEIGAFLSKCIDYYKTEYKGVRPIVCDYSEYDTLVENKNQRHEDLFNEYLVHSGDEADFLTPKELQSLLSEQRYSKTEREEFNKWLETEKKLEAIRPSKGGDRLSRRYVGLRLLHQVSGS